MTHNVLNTTTPQVNDEQQPSAYGTSETAWKTNTPQTEKVISETPVTTETDVEKDESVQKDESQNLVAAKAVPSPWDKGFEEGLRNDEMKDVAIADAINQYNGWAKDNGKDPLDIMQIFTSTRGRDPWKSVTQNEEDQKREERRNKWASTVNVLSHLGNFIGTLAGAPDQGIESSAEFTKRQQLLHDKTMEQRRQANNDFLKVYQAQQASELAKAKESRAQQQQDRLDAELFLKQKQLEWKMMESEGKMDLARRKQELEETKVEIMRQVQMGRLSQGAARIALAQMNYDLKAAGTTTTTTKSDGSVQTVVKKPGGGTPAPSANNGGGNTAPWVH